LLGAGEQVLFGLLDTLGEGGRHGLVDDLDAGTGGGVHLDAVEAGVLVLAPGADGPHLARGQRVRADGVLALDLGGGDELLHAILAQDVARAAVPSRAKRTRLLGSSRGKMPGSMRAA